MKRGEPKIDLNCDMGEVPEAIADGTQEELMRSITSVNIACGGHAGDEQTMNTTIEQALRWKLAIGAHPGYPDRANFGRLELKLPLKEISASIFDQLRALADVAAKCGTHLVHVKPHGALYNQAVRNRELAEAIAEGAARWRREESWESGTMRRRIRRFCRSLHSKSTSHGSIRRFGRMARTRLYRLDGSPSKAKLPTSPRQRRQLTNTCCTSRRSNGKPVNGYWSVAMRAKR